MTPMLATRGSSLAFHLFEGWSLQDTAQDVNRLGDHMMASRKAWGFTGLPPDNCLHTEQVLGAEANATSQIDVADHSIQTLREILRTNCLLMPDAFLMYLALGCAAGLLSGLFGIGGGVVIVPFLTWFFATQGFAPDLTMVMAVATSLATIVVTSTSAVYAHHRLGAVDWPTVGRLSPGILAGSVLGSIVADHLPVPLFKLIFAAFLLVLASHMLMAGSKHRQPDWRPGTGLLSWSGLIIGSVSAILGIGGGTLSVPLLVRCRFPIHRAVAIASACGFPIALAGSISYVLLGWANPVLPPGGLGYVYLPAFGGVVVSSFLFAPIGAWLAHRLPTAGLRRIFAVLLLVISFKLLWQAANG